MCIRDSLVVLGSLPGLQVWLTREVINRLNAVLSSPDTVGTNAFVWIGCLGGVFLLDVIGRRVAGVVKSTVAELSQDHARWIVQGKAASLDLSQFQQADYYNRWFRAARQAGSRPAALLESIGTILQSSIAVLGISVVLVQYEWWLPFVLGASLLPTLAFTVHHGRNFNRWRRKVTPLERLRGYLDQILTVPEAASEVRLYGLGDRFRRRSRDFGDEIRKQRLALQWAEARGAISAAMLGFAALAVLMIQAISAAVGGTLTLGDLGLFYAALTQGLTAMRRIVEGLGQVYQNAMFFGDLVEFLELQPRMKDGQETIESVAESLELKDVTFRYQAGDEPVLSSFNLTVAAGKTIALVGDNGAGKTTVTKLLTRLFDVESGAVLVDGNDVRQLRLHSLRRLFTVVPQEPVRYQETLADNIRMAGRPGLDDEQSVEEAVKFAGVDQFFDQLNAGLDTLLGFRFGETELSGGQWQRVALARLWYRNAPVIILDEPTSHMDSWAESDWLDRFTSFAQGRTVIMITHRFTTAMRADTIHVMKSGKIVESGSHEELVAKGGSYASSWKRQVEGV